MPLAFPAWVTEKVGPIVEAGDGTIVVSDGADTDEVRYSELLPAVADPLFEKIEPVEIGAVSRWRYAELSAAGNVLCEIVEVPTAWGDSRPPSAVESLLAKAWLVEEQYDPQGICERFANTALICWRPGGKRLSTDIVLASSGLSRRQAEVQFDLALRAKTRIAVADDSLLVTGQGAEVYARLLQRALSETHAELKFLYFYRVFERAYLYGAFTKLSADFFSDPRQAIAVAEKTVSNERLSFISLVGSSNDVSSWFELIDEEASSLKIKNHFLMAVTRSCDSDKWMLDKERWKRGCSISYKIRCAIVHAGERGPVFEEFIDAESACAALLPYLEGAAIALLRLQTS